MTNNFKSGFVSFIGSSNVGKSTLLNAILKEKVTIVSNKSRTTRNQIQAVYTDELMQIIFIDTPGIEKQHNQLGKIMNKNATSAIREADIICLLVASNKNIKENDQHIIKILQERKTPRFFYY